VESEEAESGGEEGLQADSVKEIIPGEREEGAVCLNLESLASSKEEPKRKNGEKHLQSQEKISTSRRAPKRARSTLDTFITRPTATAVATAPEDDTLLSEDELPTHLSQLLHLHTSLITSLLLHRAQHPSGVHPTYAFLKPHIERLSSRTFTLPDLRRIVFLSHYSSPSAAMITGLNLIDLGASRLSIRFVDSTELKLTNVEQLKSNFSNRLRAFWCYALSRREPDLEVPLAGVEESEHKSAIKRVLHGKSAALKRQLRGPAASAKPSTALAMAVKKGAISERSEGLLQRIRAKAASAEKPLSQAEVLVRAAEGRVKEVTEVLRGYRARGESMGLTAVVDGVRGSVKSPIAVNEAEMAVRFVCEREGWAEVRSAGGVEAVVFRYREETFR
jgi:hypothetical protein